MSIRQRSIINFALLYAVGVTLGTVLLERLPTLLQMEFAVYDPIQRWSVIDTREDFRYSTYQTQLDELHGINLDDAFFDPENDRLRRDSLGRLLERLIVAPGIQALFLDLLFYPYPNSGYADSSLVRGLKIWHDKVVLPYEINFDPIPAYGPLTASVLTVDSQLVYRPRHCGYLAPLVLVGDENYRYHQSRIAGSFGISAVRALLEAIPTKDATALSRGMPPAFEINYLLRNRERRGERQAFRITDASTVGSWTQDEVIENFGKSKVVFIGLFQERENKYGSPIDKFKTPVDEALPGIYLPVNLYLNYSAGAYFRRASWGLVFFVNLLLGLISAYYYLLAGRFPIRPLYWAIGEVIGATLAGVLVLLVLYYWWHIKFPFVITTITLAANQFFAERFLNYETHTP